MRLSAGTTTIRPLAESDADAILDLRRTNEDFLRPFEPTWPPDFLSRRAQIALIRRAEKEWQEDRGYAFGVFDGDGALIGRVALSNVVRGAWQNATIGYFIGRGANDRGHCTAAVRLTLDFAFGTAALHRVQAAVMPRNPASVRVLEKNGFRREGESRRYLRINGRWEDHVLFAITAEEHAS
jgi:[ribosomal protein S5]-alanine N-acetyltransferase